MDDFDYVPGFIPNPSVSTAAPKYDIPEQKRPEEKKRTQQLTRQQPVTNKQQLTKFIAATLALIAVVIMLSTYIYTNKAIVENKHEITKLSSEIKQAKAENIRLNAELGSVISADKIQEYAVSVLGMQKAERYQIHYFEDRDGDKVVVADGKYSNKNS